MKKIFYILIITSLFLFCTKNTESHKKKKTLLLGAFLLYSSKPANSAYLCDRKVSCRKYPTSYTTEKGKYSCLFDSTNFQYICTVTPLSETGQGNLVHYYNSKSDFIDESACIGLIKKTRYSYIGTINIDGNLNGISFKFAYTNQGYPLKYLDPGRGTTTAAGWDSVGRPWTTETDLSRNGCPYYLKYNYDDSNLKILADYVSPNGCTNQFYSPNERVFDQDYNEIQRNTFVQDSSGIVTFTENITINSTVEICK